MYVYHFLFPEFCFFKKQRKKKRALIVTSVVGLESGLECVTRTRGWWTWTHLGKTRTWTWTRVVVIREFSTSPVRVQLNFCALFFFDINSGPKDCVEYLAF